MPTTDADDADADAPTYNRLPAAPRDKCQGCEAPLAHARVPLSSPDGEPLLALCAPCEESHASRQGWGA